MHIVPHSLKSMKLFLPFALLVQPETVAKHFDHTKTNFSAILPFFSPLVNVF